MHEWCSREFISELAISERHVHLEKTVPKKFGLRTTLAKSSLRPSTEGRDLSITTLLRAFKLQRMPPILFCTKKGTDSMACKHEKNGVPIDILWQFQACHQLAETSASQKAFTMLKY